jgi:hypothetical protein
MRRFVIISIVACLAVVSCRKAEVLPSAPAAAQAQYEVSKTFGIGPVTFTVELSSAAITTADSLKCRLTLSAADGYEAEFPDIAFPEDVPGAILTGYEEHAATEGDRRIVRRDYEIEPEYEGTLTLPKVEVYSHRSGEVKEDVFETEPVDVAVKATQAAAGDLELRPLRGLVTVEQMAAQERRIWPWVLVGACVLAAGVGGIVYLARRPRRVPPPPPAHEVALRRLQEMADRGLSSYAVESFFVQVTGIVRDYIEQAFGVRAPEQTTEEFLAQMMSAAAVARHRHVLEPFLVAADEVKFACMRPDTGAMQRAFDTARSFVLESSSAAEGSRAVAASSAVEGRP